MVNHTVYEGAHGNAGAIGSFRVVDRGGKSHQLIDVASVQLLESKLINAGINPRNFWEQSQNWSGLVAHVSPWVKKTAREISKASMSTCAVIDFGAVVIDGTIPPGVRMKLVE